MTIPPESVPSSRDTPPAMFVPEVMRCSKLASVRELVTAYYTSGPGLSVALQPVAFGKSGHHGSPLSRSFNEAHVLSITQAICDYRSRQGILGAVFVGVGANALCRLAFTTALEILAANGLEVSIASSHESAPVRAVSSAIVMHNRREGDASADGIVIAPSHLRPEHGGIEYLPPHGGPLGARAARWIDTTANEYLQWGPSSVRRVPYQQALVLPTIHDEAGLLRPVRRVLGARNEAATVSLD